MMVGRFDMQYLLCFLRPVVDAEQTPQPARPIATRTGDGRSRNMPIDLITAGQIQRSTITSLRTILRSKLSL
jgi:hypothetical protein